MQHKTERLKKHLGLFLLSALILTGCNNDPSELGLDILPSEDFLEAGTYSKEIKGENRLPERIISDDGSRNAYGVLGYFNDPLMGRSKAEIVTELNISERVEGFKFDEKNYFADSLVLNLGYTYKNWYGDSSAVHTLQIFELDDRLDQTTRYYNNEEMEGRYKPEPIGEFEFSAWDNQPDSIWEQDNYIHRVNIKLNDELRDRFFNFSKEELADRNALKDAFNGLYIAVKEPEDQENGSAGSLVRIHMQHPATNVSLHYHKETYDVEEDELLKKEKKEYRFPVNEECRFFNRFEHDHPEDITFNSNNSSHIYLQGMAGSYGKFDLNELFKQWADSLSADNNLDDKKYGISGADLIFYVDEESSLIDKEDLYMPMNTEVAIVQKDEEGSFINAGYRDDEGSYRLAFTNAVSEYNSNDKIFRFRINQQYFEEIVQKIDENPNYEIEPFYLITRAPQYNFRRVVLYNNHEEYSPEVIVKYVKH
ncbi:DUF4270 family protein [Marinilabiliaceae bacterium ANBcel2]|nr:DUF4270 family protein [Marinilabiliaceae bacterium ANBcel2]